MTLQSPLDLCMLCRESFDHHSRLSRNTVAYIPSNNNQRKTARSLIKKSWGKGKGIFYLSVKHLVMVLKRTVSMRQFPSSYVLVDKKEIYFLSHTLSVYILSDNHIL